MLKKIRGKVENNPIFKFRKFWNSLDLREKRNMWSILTALRGIDSHAQDRDVKIATTGRIRRELFQEHGLEYPILVFPRTFCNSEDIEEASPKFQAHGHHFRQHVYDSVLALHKYVYKRRLRDLLKITGIDRG